MKRFYAALLVTAVMLPLAVGVKFDARPFAALGRDPAFDALSKLLSEREMLLVMVEQTWGTDDAPLLAAAADVEAALRAEPLLTDVVGKLGPDDAKGLIDGAYVLWPAARQFRLEKLLSPQAVKARAAKCHPLQRSALQAASRRPRCHRRPRRTGRCLAEAGAPTRPLRSSQPGER